MASEREIIELSAGRLSEFRLPRWKELPDLDIYMDQLMSLISRYFANYPGYEEKSMTSSMVNNYVKQEIMPKPESKKYNRKHLAALIIINIMKASIPITRIGELINERLGSDKDFEDAYDAFCESFEKACKDTSDAALRISKDNGKVSEAITLSALKTCAEQSLALDLIKNKE